MEGKDAIIAKIAEAARVSAESLVRSAEQDVEAQVSAAGREAERVHTEKRNELKAECKRMTERRLTLARLEARKTALEYRRRAVNEAYALAEQKLLDDPKLYARVMGELVKSAAEDGDVMTVGKDDRALDEKWLAGLGLKVKVTLSRDKHTGRGVLLAGATSDKTLTLSAVMAELRPKTEAKVADILRGGKNAGK